MNTEDVLLAWTLMPNPCYYCHGPHHQTPATHVVHDKRGCLAVCETHAAWRRTTSLLVGHGKECVLRGRWPAIWRHVTRIQASN
jgi:hypothetical protein